MMRIIITIICAAVFSGLVLQPAAANTLIDKIRKADTQFDARSDVRSNRYDDIAGQIAEGEGINTPGQMGETPLQKAAAGNDIDITLDLLEKGADAYALDDNGMSALSQSILFGKQTFHVLLDHYVKHKKFPADFEAYVKTTSVLERAFTDNTPGSVAFDLLLAYDVDFPAAFLQRAEETLKQYPTPEKKRRFEKLQAHLAKKKAGEKLPPPPAPPGHAILPPSSDPPLISAVREGDAKTVQGLLDKGEKPDQVSAYYNDSLFSRLAGGRDSTKLAARPALSLALLLGHKDIAKLLLEKGANPNLRGANYRNYGQDSCETPLILAVRNGDRDMIDALLAKGADLNRADCQWGKPPLAWTRDRALAAQLLEKGADPNVGGLYTSPLRAALENRDKEMLTLLLEKGADPNRASQGMQDETALHHVAREAYDGSYVSLLLAHGADAKLRNAEGLTAYDIAVSKGRKDIAALLEKGGAESGDPNSVMLKAIGRGDLATMEKLLKGGLDPGSQPYTFTVAYAASHERFTRIRLPAVDMIRLLAQYGANVKATGENSVSLLHMAQDAAMVDFLAANGVDVNAVDRWRTTPLHAAAKTGNVAVVEALLKHGADPEKKNDSGQSPLSVALQGPANRQMADGPPTDWAREGPPYLEVIRLLAAGGASIESMGGAGPPVFGQTGEGYQQFRAAGLEIAKKSYKPRIAAPAPAVTKPRARPAVPQWDVYVLFRMISERFINKYDAVRWQTGKDPAALCNIDVMAAAHALFDANKGSAKDFKTFINTLRLRGKHNNRNIDGTAAVPPAKFQSPTLLQMAVYYKDMPVIKALLEAGADATLQDSGGNTALHYATQGYSMDVETTLAVIDLLLEAGVAVNSRNNEGETALMTAGFTAIGGKMMKTAQMQIIERLLQKGADPKITRNDGYSLADNIGATLSHLEGMKKTEYIEAQTKDYRRLADALAQAGLTKDKWRQQGSQQQQRTPLQEAVDRLDVEAVKALVAQGADVNEGSYPPLMSAANAGDRGVEIATLLIAKGARLDLRLPYDTILSKAMLQPEHGNMVDLLLSKGLKPAPADLLGFYSDSLTQRGKESLRKILDTGVDPNTCDRSGESPLYKAANSRNAEAVEILLAYGARVDYCGKDARESGGGSAAVKQLLSAAVAPEDASIYPDLEKIWYAASDCRIHDKPE